MKSKIYAESPSEQNESTSSTKKLNENLSQLSILKQGAVTEITMGDRTFQVTDPKRIEQSIVYIERHEEALFLLRQRLKEQSTVINNLRNDVETLKQEVQRLKEITNGYGSREYTGY